MTLCSRALLIKCSPGRGIWAGTARQRSDRPHMTHHDPLNRAVRVRGASGGAISVCVCHLSVNGWEWRKADSMAWRKRLGDSQKARRAHARISLEINATQWACQKS
jgi:hypothetical protein